MAVWNVIQHDELSSAAASWTKSSIPTTYDYLYLVASLRNDNATYAPNYIPVRLNGSSGTNYDYTNLQGVYTSQYTAGTSFKYCCMNPSGTSTASIFGVFEMWIMNPNTAQQKSIIMKANSPRDANAQVQNTLTGGRFRITADIDEITIYGPVLGTSDISQYSTITLYGINGAA
tara:strand:- start:186 stop:707 length:522 start_codon:yes stop_codon:yes gene_type:complete